jgi:outer membrane lipoprotein SlyB
MPQALIPLTDDEILAVADDPALVAKFTSEERRRLSRLRPQAPPAPTLIDRAVDALPTLGGLTGGVVGGIGGTAFGVGVGGVRGAVGGATLGGAFGESARQLVNRARGAAAPATATDAALRIGQAGAREGASELAGAGLVKGAQMAGRGLMDFAIRPAPTVAEEFGDIAATAIRERLPVGRMLPGALAGSEIAREALRDAAGATRRLYDDAGRAGVSFSPAAMARGPVTELAGKIAKQPISDSELGQLSRLFAEYLNTQPSRMAPVAVKDMKQAAQRIARPIFRALHQGNIPPAGDALKAQFNRAIADGAKESLEAAIPGVAVAEARTQGLIGATKAIRRAEARRLPLVAELAAPIAGGVAGGLQGGDAEGVGKGVGVALLTRALLSPRTTSRAALTLTQEQVQQVLRQMPRGAVYTLLEQVTGTTPPAVEAP